MNLGNALAELGRADAGQLLRDALERLRAKQPSGCDQFFAGHIALGRQFLSLDRAEQAQPLLEEAHRMSREQYRAGDWRMPKHNSCSPRASVMRRHSRYWVQAQATLKARLAQQPLLAREAR